MTCPRSPMLALRQALDDLRGNRMAEEPKATLVGQRAESHLIRIVAPHFIAGIEVENGVIVRAAPIVKYMIGWPEGNAIEYAKGKGWQTNPH